MFHRVYDYSQGREDKESATHEMPVAHAQFSSKANSVSVTPHALEVQREREVLVFRDNRAMGEEEQELNAADTHQAADCINSVVLRRLCGNN